jgi:hypothetical protein
MTSVDFLSRFDSDQPRLAALPWEIFVYIFEAVQEQGGRYDGHTKIRP